jgi:hypothetical protein
VRIFEAKSQWNKGTFQMGQRWVVDVEDFIDAAHTQPEEAGSAKTMFVPEEAPSVEARDLFSVFMYFMLVIKESDT